MILTKAIFPGTYCESGASKMRNSIDDHSHLLSANTQNSKNMIPESMLKALAAFAIMVKAQQELQINY